MLFDIVATITHWLRADRGIAIICLNFNSAAQIITAETRIVPFLKYPSFLTVGYDRSFVRLEEISTDGSCFTSLFSNALPKV